MKICLVNPFETWEGTGRRLSNIGKVLYENGHDITLVSTKSRKRIHFEIPFDIIELPPRLRNKRISCVLSSFPKLFYLLKNKFDIIHFIKSLPYAAIPSLIAGRLRSERLVLDFDDWEGKEGLGRFMPPIIREIHSSFERRIPHYVDGIVVVSTFLKNYIRKIGCNKPVIHLPHGINIREYKNIRKIDLPNNSISIVGNLSGISDLPYALKAISIAIKKVDLNLLVIGEGERRKEFEELSKKLGIDKNVNFLGWVDEEKKKRILYSSDIVLMPMVDNIQNRMRVPMKLLEYMGIGCAIIANDVGDVKNILGDAGILIGYKEEDLANAIIHLLENGNLRRRLRRKARKRAKFFDWKVLVREILEPFYYEVIKK